VRNLAALGVPENDIKIILLEVPLQNWGIRGGVPASEIDIGFKIDV
jgi:phenylpyruvate tautomerase PptA (4-oxalocrotonate tautomerase family)